MFLIPLIECNFILVLLYKNKIISHFFQMVLDKYFIINAFIKDNKFSVNELIAKYFSCDSIHFDHEQIEDCFCDDKENVNYRYVNAISCY